MWNFHDQRVIVTGGTRGIGSGIAKAFLKAGASVIVTYVKNEKAAHQWREENGQYSSQIDLYQFDVGKEDEVKNFFRQIDEKYPSIEVLVNNSGIRADSLLCTMEQATWEKVIGTNLTGTFNMSKFAVLSFMKNRYGRIINISSLSAKLGLQGQANYAASKAGQIALSLSLSKEVARKNITVNCVAPGFIDTELLEGLDAEKVKEYEKQIPLRRFGRVEEVAHGVLFLASREASYVTGTTLEIGGGL